MVPTMEVQWGCVAEWRVILLGKGLEVNASESIVIFNSKAVVGYSEKCLRGVCRKEYRLRYVYRMQKVYSHTV